MRLAIAVAAILALASPAGGDPAGPLLAVGGGDIPDAIFARFIEMSGGAGKARIVVLPMSSTDPESGKWAVEAMLKLGAQAEKDAAQEKPRELQGPKGPEPTRYGDWERNGIATDF